MAIATTSFARTAEITTPMYVECDGAIDLVNVDPADGVATISCDFTGEVEVFFPTAYSVDGEWECPNCGLTNDVQRD
jgi:hypothetical protein